MPCRESPARLNPIESENLISRAALQPPRSDSASARSTPCPQEQDSETQSANDPRALPIVLRYSEPIHPSEHAATPQLIETAQIWDPREYHPKAFHKVAPPAPAARSLSQP